MAGFLARRLLYTLLILLIASIVVFYGLRVAPGSVTESLTNPLNRGLSRAELEHRLGLDKPLLVQYLVFLKHVVTGQLGSSLISDRSIGAMIADAGLNTLILTAAAAVLTFAVSIPLGILAAARQNSVFDQGTMLLAVLGMGIPSFFLAILLIRVFAVDLGWLPVSGTGGIEHLVLPAVVLAAESIAVSMRVTRVAVIEELRRDYIRTLRAKGVPRRRIVWIHAARNALPPVLALGGVLMRTLLGYTLIVEVIFRWPGLGFNLVDAVLKRDYAVAQVLSLLLIFAVVIFNLLADIGQHLADPRVRVRGKTA